MEMQLSEMDIQFKLQQKQVEISSVLQAHQANASQMVQSEMGVDPAAMMAPEGQQPGVPPNGEAIATPKQQPPNVQTGAGVTEAAQANTAPPPNAQSEEDPLSSINPDVKNIVVQIMKLPKAYRDKPISTLPNSMQKQVRTAMQQLEKSEEMKKKSQIDMRQMPEKLPPRRDSLK
jgi:hypothetical protein